MLPLVYGRVVNRHSFMFLDIAICYEGNIFTISELMQNQVEKTQQISVRYIYNFFYKLILLIEIAINFDEVLLSACSNHFQSIYL